jgi:iduronate 2-sulfatase
MQRILRFTLVLLALPAAAAAEEKRLNVLFIVADDLNCDLGSYGAEFARTPRLDAFARRAVRFDRAYTQYPHCSPSRASFLTGRRPAATGVFINPSPAHPLSPHFREKLPRTVTLPQLFRQHGWFSARVGKLYHYGVPSDIGTSGLDDPLSWDLVVNPRGRDRDNQERIFSLQPGQFGGTLSWWADPEGTDSEHTDGLVATEAIRLLERFRREDRPFFLGVGFYRPHTPFVAPREYFDLHPLDGIALPPLSEDDQVRRPAPAYASARPDQDAAAPDTLRQAIQAYRAATSFMDAQVGRVLAALDRLGLAENTIVVFTSDHGYHLGDHGLWQKVSLFERSARVPLLVAVPGTRGAGRSTAALAELLDLYPTLAAQAGLRAPDYLDGTDLSPVFADPGAPGPRTQAVTEIRRPDRTGGAVRTARWRYIRWSTGEAQLFDMVGDPGETRNLAGRPEFAAAEAELRGRLAEVLP